MRIRDWSSDVCSSDLLVLPAPLRPSRVTTSPSRTSKATPCRTWLSPYQPSRPDTASRGWAWVAPAGTVALAASGMSGSDVGLDQLGIVRARGVVAFGEDLAAREDGDVVGQRGDHRKVVLAHAEIGRAS